LPFLAAGGHILCDDTNRRDMQETIERWKSEFPNLQFENIPLVRGACLISGKN
jgi:hypothetical protein